VRKHFDAAASQADGEKQVVITRSTNIKRPPQLPAIILAAPIAAPTVSSLAPPCDSRTIRLHGKSLPQQMCLGVENQ
jgi:hypothetical protein